MPASPSSLYEHFKAAQAKREHAETFARRVRAIAEPAAKHLGLTDADASDVAQDASIVVLTKPHAFRGTNDAQVKAWITGIARNLSLKTLRQNGRSDSFSDAEALDSLGVAEQSETPHARVLSEIMNEDVRRALEQLKRRSSKYHEAVVLVHLQGLSITEAAKKAGTDENNIRVRLCRGRAALKKTLSQA